MDRLRTLFSPFMELGNHAKEHGGEYTVRSIYFDTPELECYFQKLAGVKRRNKVRLRGYNGNADTGTVFFEIKKNVDEPLYKNRAPMSFAAAKNLLKGEPVEECIQPSDKAPQALENARRFLYHIHARKMRPVVTVIYEREPYQGILKDRLNDLRITFDKHLRAVAYPMLEELFEEKHPMPADERFFILEVKFNQYLPSWVKLVIASLGLKKVPASKYVICMDAVREASADSHKMSVGDWQLFEV